MASHRPTATGARRIWLLAAAGALLVCHGAVAATVQAPLIAAQPPATPPTATALATSSASETLNLSVVGMIHETDALVRVVLVVLLVASVLTWTIWVAKNIELVRSRRRLAADVRSLTGVQALGELPTLASPAARAIVDVIGAELARAGDLRQPACAEGLKERVTVRLMSVETALAQRMSAGINVVGSIGATSPFIGLFGTVWGIMASFIGIARSQATNLAAVAPGIAEALLTTAVGLAVAIPAVLIYNAFTRSMSGYRALLAEASNASACLLSLEIERLQGDGVAAARAAPRKEAIIGL